MLSLNKYFFEKTIIALYRCIIGVPLVLFAMYAYADKNSLNHITNDECIPYELASYAFDYRIQHGHNAWLVKDIWRAHIHHALQQMRTVYGRGKGGNASGNLDYALRRIPNDPRSLKAVIDYSFLIKSKPQHVPLIRAPECYLKKAIRFAPDDPMPRFLYGYYLYKRKQYEGAIAWYERGLKIDPDSSEGHYNLGLTLFKMKRFTEAQEQARIAYKLGYPLPWLRKKLSKLGYPIN